MAAAKNESSMSARRAAARNCAGRASPECGEWNTLEEVVVRGGEEPRRRWRLRRA